MMKQPDEVSLNSEYICHNNLGPRMFSQENNLTQKNLDRLLNFFFYNIDDFYQFSTIESSNAQKMRD